MHENIKILKTQSLLQEALQEAISDLEDSRLKNIAVTRVECTRGKEMACVFLDENSLGDLGANYALKLLKKASGAIRANIGAQLSWYKTPNLTFAIDESLAEMNRLEAIFKKIHAKDCNLSLDKHSADFGIFGASQTPSLVSSPKIPKNNESHTENPSVVLNAEYKNDSSLRDSQHESKQSKNSPSLAEGARGWVDSTKRKSQ